MTRLPASQSPDNAPANLDPGQPNGPNRAGSAPKTANRRARKPAETRTVNATSIDRGDATVCEAVEVETATDSATPARPMAPEDDTATLDATYRLLARDPRNAPYLTALGFVAQGYSQAKACDGLGIDGPQLWRWANATTERRQWYAHAREGQARSLADMTLDIGDAATPEDVQVAKLRTDTRKWLASKLLPKEYGDRLEVDARAVVGSVDFGRLSDDQIRRVAAGEALGSVLAGAVAEHVKALGSGEVVEEGS